MTDLARLVVRLEAQSAQLTKELQAARSKVESFEKSVSSAAGRAKSAIGGFAAGLVGALSVAEVVRFASATIDMADEVNRASQVVGLSAESFSALQYAAMQAGVESATFQTALTRLSKTAVEAQSGAGAAAKAFDALGVSVKGADGALKPVDQLLVDTAEAFSQYADGAEKTAAAQAIFGKSGADLIPLLNEGRDGIDALRSEAERLGLVISTDAAQAADEFNDTIDRMRGSVAGTAQGVIQRLLPSLNAMAERAADASEGATALEAVLEGLAVAFKVVASGAVIAGNAFQAVGKTIGGFAAIAVSAIQGDFTRAVEIYKQLSHDTAGDIRDIGEGIAAVWHGSASAAEESSARSITAAGKLDAGLKRLKFGEIEEGTKKAAKATDEYAISLEAAAAIAREAESIFGPLADEAAQVFEKTRTPLERFNAEIERLNRLRDTFVDGKPLIDADTYGRAVAMAQDDLESLSKKTEETAGKMSVYMEEAARNMQSAFADFLFNPFDGGLDGMLQSFEQTLRRMAAEAAAAQIFEALGFPGTGSGGTGGGGLDFGSILGSIGSSVFDIFSSGTAGTGVVTTSPAAARSFAQPTGAGELALAGSGRPDMVLPRSSTRVAAQAEATGMTVNINIPISAPQGSVHRETIQQIASAAERGARRASARNS